MPPEFVAEPPPVGAVPRQGFWRRALAGLTPQVVAVVLAIIALRIVSANGEGFVAALRSGTALDWFVGQLPGAVALGYMAVLMLVGVFATANLGPQQGRKRVAALGAAIVLSVGAAILLRIANNAVANGHVEWDRMIGMSMYVGPRYVLLGALLTAIAELVRREVATTRRAQQAEMNQAELEREMAEARLQVLQAQIEPHFLFNTLANVRRLCERGDPDGRRMLDMLMRYLEVALPSMRHSHSTLGQEAELIEAYLDIQRVRMGPRLAFGIDVPASLHGREVPPMMLLTLVENAVKHGVSPKSDGGRIHVMARATGERLELSVADTGVGFVPGSGGGVGLANIRARLAAQFGSGASLELENNELGGATATISLPLAGASRAQPKHHATPGNVAVAGAWR